MTDDQAPAPGQPGKAQAAIARVARAATQPAGKDIDWERSARSAPLSEQSP
jgi:hypothetical protein